MNPRDMYAQAQRALDETTDRDLSLTLRNVPFCEHAKVYRLLEALADNFKGKYGVVVKGKYGVVVTNYKSLE